ncbi:MAG: hypothetical protein PSN04_01240 [Methyloprofundus sp.]|nr:hypothetical protein [Methyloprofundus sp.]
MGNPSTEIDLWLIEDLDNIDEPEVWDANFVADRQVVVRQLGPYQKIFLRPEKFVKRFYHTVFPLAIKELILIEDIHLYDGFCHLNATIKLSFQASFNYAENNIEHLSVINAYISKTYEPLISEIIQQQLLNLEDPDWVKSGLEKTEKAIALSISEMLVLQGIQSQASCTLLADFDGFPDVRVSKNNLYHSVLRKNFEITEQHREELFRQDQATEQQALKHKEIALLQAEKEAYFTQEQKAQEAKLAEQLLQDKERQQLAQFAIEVRIYEEKLKHEYQLKDLALKAKLQEKQRANEQKLITEEKNQAVQAEHLAAQKEKELKAEITRFEHNKSLWRQAKDKVHKQEIEQEQLQNQLKFDIEQDALAHQEKRRSEMLEASYKTTKNSDIYLRKELELLELEKKRVELRLAIKSQTTASES